MQAGKLSLSSLRRRSKHGTKQSQVSYICRRRRRHLLSVWYSVFQTIGMVPRYGSFLDLSTEGPAEGALDLVLTGVVVTGAKVVLGVVGSLLAGGGLAVIYVSQFR